MFCFLFLFCGVLDVGVIVINEEMKMVVVYVIVDLVKEFVLFEVILNYGYLLFGVDYLILMLFDLCLIV